MSVLAACSALSTTCADGRERDVHVLRAALPLFALLLMVSLRARRRGGVHHRRTFSPRQQSTSYVWLRVLFVLLLASELGAVLSPWTSFLFPGRVPRQASTEPRSRSNREPMHFFPLVEAASKPRCIPLNYVNGVAFGVLDMSFSPYESYFCSSSAPQDLQCRCGFMNTCKTHRDPFHRNLGRCACCHAWVWVLIVLALISSLLVLGTVVFKGFLVNQWFFAGYTRPIRFLAPRSRNSALCPPDQPFPDDTFFCESTNFVNYYSPEDQQRLHDEEMRNREERSGGAAAGSQGRRTEAMAAQRRLQRIAAATPPKQPLLVRQWQLASGEAREETTRASKSRERSVEPFAVEAAEVERYGFSTPGSPEREPLFDGPQQNQSR